MNKHISFTVAQKKGLRATENSRWHKREDCASPKTHGGTKERIARHRKLTVAQKKGLRATENSRWHKRRVCAPPKTHGGTKERIARHRDQDSLKTKQKKRKTQMGFALIYQEASPDDRTERGFP